MARNNHPPSFDGQQAKAESNRLTEEAKNQLSDLGEDVSDFVVQTQSKVDAQIKNLTKTAKRPEGISVLDETGRLRSTFDILLDISEVYQDIIDKDNEYGTNTSNALVE